MLTGRSTIYEINAAVFLNETSRTSGRATDFANVPDSTWDEIAKLPIDAVWFMGVWERSPTARKLADENPDLRATLKDLKPSDILGSAYSVYDYVVDDSLGGNAGLAIARAKLKERGIGLILDYVPNHVAVDHPWTVNNADYFLPGTAAELRADSGAFIQRPAGIIAKGKDPNFAPWSDVVQLNAFSPTLRAAVTKTIIGLSDMCDGIRCDMAMLMMNEVFAKTWGDRAGSVPPEDYWATIISEVKKHNPSFTFIAEVYWDKEKTLLGQGFDFCYDKKLYDGLVAGSVRLIKGNLRQSTAYQNHLLRFLENHDEPRAASLFSSDQHMAAATIMSTVEGAHLYHEGQFEGRRVRVPVHLNRRPNEAQNNELHNFYVSLLATVRGMMLNEGEWQPCKFVTPLTQKESRQVLAWRWHTPAGDFIVVVNYSNKKVRGRLELPKNMAHRSGREVFGNGNPVDTPHLLRGKKIAVRPWWCSIVKLGGE